MTVSQRRDLGALQSDVWGDRKDRAIAKPRDRIFGWRVEGLALPRLREGECRAFVAVDRQPLHLADGMPRDVGVADQVLLERRQPREAPANGRGRRALGLAHEALPCNPE